MESITFSTRLKISASVKLWSKWVSFIKHLQTDFVKFSPVQKFRVKRLFPFVLYYGWVFWFCFPPPPSGSEEHIKRFFPDSTRPCPVDIYESTWRVCKQFLKAPDPVWLSWVTHLCNVVRSSGAVPLDWQTRVVVRFLKGRTTGCSHITGITVLL